MIFLWIFGRGGLPSTGGWLQTYTTKASNHLARSEGVGRRNGRESEDSETEEEVHLSYWSEFDLG